MESVDFLHYLICNNPSLLLTTDLIPLRQRLTMYTFQPVSPELDKL